MFFSEMAEGSNDQPPVAAVPIARAESDHRRSCWVCFANDEDEPRAIWIRPCRCRGSTMWVHEGCLQRWVDEKQKGDPVAKVSCAQCGTDYIIIYPPLNVLLKILEQIDRMVVRICPLLTGGVILGSLYWSAVTFGAVTLMEILGYREAMRSLEQAEPTLLLIGLPTIPVLLIVGRMIRWEDSLIRFLHRYILKVPRRIQGAGEEVGQQHQHPAVRDPASATRILCGALVMPTVAMLCGKWFLSGLRLTSLQRTLLGGLGFVVIKGFFKIYLKHSQEIRKNLRLIKNFEQGGGNSSSNGSQDGSAESSDGDEED